MSVIKGLPFRRGLRKPKNGQHDAVVRGMRRSFDPTKLPIKREKRDGSGARTERHTARRGEGGEGGEGGLTMQSSTSQMKGTPALPDLRLWKEDEWRRRSVEDGAENA